MKPSQILQIVVYLFCTTLSSMAQAPAAKKEVPPILPTPQQRQEIKAAIKKLEAAIDSITHLKISSDLLADAEIYLKGASFMDRLDEWAAKSDPQMVLDQIDTGLSRVDSLKAGAVPWKTIKGAMVRGYRSEVDGSVQPYAIEIPENLDLNMPARLDVVLHGRNTGLNESRFIKAHEGKKVPPDRPGLTLHVFGRTNNAYRWAGETDVFEAIKAVKRNYKVDEDRIVLKGFSMGGAGAWAIGLHYPSLWSSVEAGAGFVDTWGHAKLDPKKLPEWRVKAAHIYDSVDYALNSYNVPIVGYGGELDPQLRASNLMVEALKGLGVKFKTDGLVMTAEGLDFQRIIGKGMGHKVDPASEALMKAFHDDRAKAGLNRKPNQIRFVTFTLAYNTAAWISIERMTEHYQSTTVEANLEGELATIKTSNVNVLGVDRHVAETIKLDGNQLSLRLSAKGLLPKVYYRKTSDGWEVLDHESSLQIIENQDGFKSPTIHGPIDDAFRSQFLIVVPTGKPWNPAINDWAKSTAESFEVDWIKWMRGDQIIKKDVDVNAEDIESRHLILFGDPGSNLVIKKLLKDLPLGWSETELKLGKSYDAKTHAPALIVPNPLNPKRYVVINSGQTFGASDFIGTNALLFPKLGDWGVFKIAPDGKSETLQTSGFFNERWRLP